MTKRKNQGDEAQPRPINPLTHPRAFDAKHGYRLNDDLFPGLTPAGWRPKKPKIRREQ